MRMARVLGHVTLNRKLPEFPAGQLLIVEAMDPAALEDLGRGKLPGKRSKPMPEALVVFDRLGAGVGQIVAVSEGREATAPFYPQKVPADAYCSAILDTLQCEDGPTINVS